MKTIDNVNKTFGQLSKETMPAYYNLLLERMKNPIELRYFKESGIGEQTIINRISQHYWGFPSNEDLSGCYVLTEKGKHQYVGISKSVGRRLYQHIKGTTHNHATLAYNIAKNTSGQKGERDKNMGDLNFQVHFDKAKERISTWTVSVIDIKNPVELYLFELFASLKFNTYEFNTFETH